MTHVSTDTYQRLLEHMDEAVWMGNAEEETVYANPKFCDMLGYSLEEIIGEKSAIFRDKKTAKKLAGINEKRKKWISSTYTGNMVTKSWEIIPVSTNGTPIPGGWTIGIMTDLRDIKKKEENEKILYQAVQYSTDAVILCDRKGKILSWNRGAQIIFGHKESIIGKPLSTLLLKKDIQKILQAKEVITKYELKGKHKNKNPLAISITQTPMLNSTWSEVISYLLICRDITNYRRAEEEIKIKYDKIREVYESMGIIKRQSDYIFELLNMCEDYYYDIKSVGDFIVTSSVMLTKVDACVLRRYDKKDNKLKMISHFWFQEGWDGKSSIKYKNSLAKKSFESGSPLKILDINRETLYQSIWLARKNSLTSLLLIPLKSKWELIGTLSLYTRPDKKTQILENDFIEKYAQVIQIVLADAL